MRLDYTELYKRLLNLKEINSSELKEEILTLIVADELDYIIRKPDLDYLEDILLGYFQPFSKKKE